MAERCITALRSGVSSDGGVPVPPVHIYPSTEREVSLLIPDSVVPSPEEVMSGPPHLSLQDRLRLRRMATHQR